MSLFLGAVPGTAPCFFSSLLLPSEFGGRRHKTVLAQSDDDPIKPAQSDFNSPHPWYVFPAVNCRSLPFTPSALFMRIMRRSSLPVDISSGPWERQPLPAALWGAAGFRSPTCVLFFFSMASPPGVVYFPTSGGLLSRSVFTGPVPSGGLLHSRLEVRAHRYAPQRSHPF